MYYTYILKSSATGKIYIGQTNNLEDRIKRHNSNQNKYTKNKGPWKLIFSKKFETRSEAIHLEIKLKSYKNTEFLLNKIKEF
jgi:putative endonuclease